MFERCRARVGRARRPLLFALLSAVVAAAPLSAQEAASTAPAGDESSRVENAAGPARYLIDTGPLRVRDQFPLSMGFLLFDPIGATVLEPGGWQVDLISTLTNTFATSDVLEGVLEERTGRSPLTSEFLTALDASDPGAGVFVVDGELMRSAIAVRRGIGRGVQLEVSIPFLSYRGGALDSSVESFHDTFSFEQGGRLGVPRDTCLVDVRGRSGAARVDRDPGLVLGDIVVGAKFRLAEPNAKRRYHLALDALVKLPTGDEDALASNGSLDFGAQLVATRYYARSCLHLSVGLLRLGEWDALGIDSQIVPSALIGWERSLGARTSGLAQLTVSQTPFDDLGLDELSASSIQLTIGVKRVIWRDHVFFVGLTENIQNFDNSQDIGIHLGLTRTF